MQPAAVLPFLCKRKVEVHPKKADSKKAKLFSDKLAKGKQLPVQEGATPSLRCQPIISLQDCVSSEKVPFLLWAKIGRLRVTQRKQIPALQE
jgi:hypothetical protein